MICKKAIKIYCEIYSDLSQEFLLSLKELGIINYNVHNGRAVTLFEKEIKFFGNLTVTKLEESPTDIYDFLVNVEDEVKVIKYIIVRNELLIPGRGSIYSIKVELFSKNDIDTVNKVSDIPFDRSVPILSKLTGIRCIVQNGKSNSVIKSALEMGCSVPIVTLGTGAGLRDSLGLLRITIPSEKEIINFLVNEGDSNEILNILIETSKIYDVGKGFIYTYPINFGLVNTKIYRLRQKHAATMDQIISAIDHTKGNADWRRKFSKLEKFVFSNKINILTNLLDVNFTCNEGYAMEVIQKVLKEIGTGATISRVKSYISSKTANISPARENSYMTISNQDKNQIIEIFTKAGCFEPEISGIVEISSVQKASTYKK